MVQEIHAVVVAGGSAYGLAAADGVMQWLEEHGVGFDARVAKVPIVPAAIIFDLDVGDARARPTAEMGYAACQAASTGVVEEGSVGAGTGARVGTIMGARRAMKSGIGSASISLGGGLVVGAIVAVNALGDVVDPRSGEVLAGLRKRGCNQIEGTLNAMRGLMGKMALRFAANTVVGVVATNARLTKDEANKVAQMAQDGVARAIRPAHTMLDGDTLFALATGTASGDVNLVGAYAAEAVSDAIVNGVRAAQTADGLPAHRDLALEGQDCSDSPA
jgi:L-aminopeptidase/D-esterase-like protein